MSLGVHVSKISKVLTNTKRKTMQSALEDDCESLNLSAAQIYTHGPRNSYQNKMDYPAIKKYCQGNKIDLYVHSAYTTASIWNLTEGSRDLSKTKGYLKLFEGQLNSCKEIGANGLVVHFPRTKTLKDVMETLDCSIFKIVASRYDVPILFEMVPVKDKGKIKNNGKIIKESGYVTAGQINRFCSKVKLPKKQWGIVLDTSHLWGAGIDTSDKQTQDEWFEKLEHPEMIKLIHLNGSEKKTFNSGRDVHIIAFSADDDMYNKYSEDIDSLKNSGVYSIVKFAKEKNISIICEINRGTEKEVRHSLKLIRELMKKC